MADDGGQLLNATDTRDAVTSCGDGGLSVSRSAPALVVVGIDVRPHVGAGHAKLPFNFKNALYGNARPLADALHRDAERASKRRHVAGRTHGQF